MADRRMFAKSVIDTDTFMDMPLSTQALYFHLAIRADDDGFVGNPRKIQRMVGCSDDDLKLLIAKQFLIPFDTGVVVIRHWRIHNYIQKDRYKETVYQAEKSRVTLQDGIYDLNSSYPDCIQNVSKVDTQVRLGKDRLGKDRLGNKERTPNGFSPPTLEEVQAYCKERNSPVDPKQFYEYFTTGNWIDSKGQKVKNWKQKFITWEKYNQGVTTQKVGANGVKLSAEHDDTLDGIL